MSDDRQELLDQLKAVEAEAERLRAQLRDSSARGEVTLRDSARADLLVGVNFGTLVYGQTPTDDERRRLAWYLAGAARRAQPAASRRAICSVSQKLLANACAPAGPLASLDDVTRRQVEAVALACVELLVRSSACVEGRNGQLALLRHSLHHPSNRRLKSLTVIHNDYNRRPDGSTAAERFFGQKPDDLFPWLLDRLDVPVRPRAARARVAA